jgi:LmbE family N-acetylglucosaminyl deacetylase
MIGLPLPSGRTGAGLRLLVVGAHSDDIEIGCGGTVLRLVEDGLVASVGWVVLSAAGERAEEARASAAAFCAKAPEHEVVVGEFRDGFLPYQGWEVKSFFEELKRFDPDLVLTHRRDDAHQDHRLVGELTWNTFRDHLVLEYEIPKYDGDLGQPNVFVTLDRSRCERKIELLLEHFSSQRDRRWFTEDTFWSILRLRGLESNSPSTYAEAFHARKLVL